MDEDPFAACKGILFAAVLGLIFWAGVVLAARCFHHGC